MHGSSTFDSKNQHYSWSFQLQMQLDLQVHQNVKEIYRWPFDLSLLLYDSKMTLFLTVAGRSQHLSRLIQLKLQIISNIWSWNYTTEEWKNIEGCYKWLPFLIKMHIVENRTTSVPQRNRNMEAFMHPSSHWEQLKLNCASTHKRIWIFIISKVVGYSSKRAFPSIFHFS